MGNIFYLMGKSSSGKDTLYKRVIERCSFLKTVILYTTRPIRHGENHGVEYFFVDDEKCMELQSNGKIIELRAYNTVHGIWKYFTVDDEQINLENNSYLMIGTLESYEKMCEYFNRDIMVPIYVNVEDGERLKRALTRELKQDSPKYAEMCRRFLADTEDFSKENLEKCGIDKQFENLDIEVCLEEIVMYILKKV